MNLSKVFLQNVILNVSGTGSEPRETAIANPSSSICSFQHLPSGVIVWSQNSDLCQNGTEDEDQYEKRKTYDL